MMHQRDKDTTGEQRRIDRWSLRVAREGLEAARAKRLPVTAAMYQRDVQRLTARVAMQRRAAQ